MFSSGYVLNIIKLVACFEKLIRGVFYNNNFHFIIPVVNIQIQYEIFMCVEGGISDPNLEAG